MSGATRTRQAILFANPRSGRGRRWLWRILHQCNVQGIELVSVHFNVDADYVERVLRSAEEAGIKAILVAGGDGTIGTVVQHLVNRPYTLGVIPAGTSNDFARSLDIPMDAPGAISVIADGRATRVDVGCVGEQMFAHAAIIGINTQFARRAQQLRHWIGRLSYPLAAVDVYRHRESFPLRIIVDGKEECFDAFEAAFVNAPAYGGPLHLEIPEAGLTDRCLEVVVVQTLAWQAILQALPRLIARRGLALPGTRSFPVRSARVETEEPMPITIDGEIAGTTPTTVSILPAALRVFVPESFILANHEQPVQR